METPPLPTDATPPDVAVAATSSASRQKLGLMLKWRHPAVWIGLFALVVAGQWLDSRMQIAQLQQELARRLAESDGQSREGRALARQSQQSLAELQIKYGVLETKIAETQSQALALEAMYQEISSSRDERLLAEVEQAIAIAVQQLQFAGNVEAALLALQSADTRLAHANQPRLQPLRKLLASDIERLKAAPTADIIGMSSRIESVVAAADSLPLAFEHRPQITTGAAPESSINMANQSYWQQWMADLWHEFKQLARVERIDRGDPALLAPNQSFFLRENIKLRLLSARLAMLQRDARTFRAEVNQAHETLDRYFDTHAKSVQVAQATLRQLAAADVSADLPRLIESLEGLRSLKLSRARNSNNSAGNTGSNSGGSATGK